MTAEDLQVLSALPFLFWVKDRSGIYLWGNQQIGQLAGGAVVGKTDDELPWANNAVALRAADTRVFSSGTPEYLHEYVDRSSRGEATLNVCKWLDEFEGEKCCFGISFVIC
ncbi:PAS domain-containing protein [Microbulbifer sp. OS29]|uniref:PAS domain-containing protein n=1 Tax=Microbulbifer okhotskensis TaxID=2926617 RepID=A0A9X2J4N4_9GAMM|nr:PAS domain-containing protein [Microbulbifer okhotskensis]MCO1332730.1 PAS domain-containing protein [Microbulbifer okhotskensis]